jgi:hypothetical protein
MTYEREKKWVLFLSFFSFVQYTHEKIGGEAPTVSSTFLLGLLFFFSFHFTTKHTHTDERVREKRERLTTVSRGNLLAAGPSGNREESWIKNRERVCCFAGREIK